MGLHRRAAELAVAAGALVLIGWWLGIQPLTTVVAGWTSMKPNTAIAFIFAGVALWSFQDRRSLPPNDSPLRHVGLGSALVVAAIGALTLAEYARGVDFGIDGLLSRNAITAAEAGPPGRMAILTAFGFLLLGSALALLHRERHIAVAQGLVTVIAVLFLLPLVSVAYGRLAFQMLPPFDMAVHTAVVFIILAFGILWASADQGFMRTATGHGAGAQSIRRLLPVMMAAPLTLGWLEARTRLYYDTGFGSAIAVVGACLVLAYAFWHHASYLSRIEAERDRFFTMGLDLLAVGDLAGRFHRVNPAFSDVLGWTSAELTAHPFLEFVHPDDRAATLAELERLRSGTPTLNFSNRYRCKDGSWRRLSWTSVPVPSEGLMYATARDMTALYESHESSRRREEYLAVLLDSIGDAVLSTDAEGRVTALNAVAVTLTGWTADDARGRPVEQVFQIVNAHTRQPVPIPVRDALVHGTVQGLANDTVLIARDGTERPIADSCAPIRSLDDRILGAVLVFRDVTEAYAAARTLRASEQRLRTILDNMTTFVGEMTSDGVLMEANRAALDAGGIRRADVVGKPLEDTWWFSYSQAVQAQIRHDVERAQRGEAVRHDIDVRMAGGSLIAIDFMLVPVRDDTGRVVKLIPSGVDISERKRAEKQILELNERLAETVTERTGALRQSERRFADLFESAPDAIVITNRHGAITLVNQQAERMFGWRRADLIGQPVERLMPRQARDGHIALRDRYLTSGAGPRAMGAGRDLRAMRKDGREFPVEISLSPMESDGEVVVAAAVRDITERRLLEAQFLQSQKMESVGRLAGGIAHDFNNVLTVISGTAELAAEDLSSADPLQQDLTTIRDAAIKAASLTRQLLAFSRKQILQPSVTNLNTVVAGSQDMLQRLIGEHIQMVADLGEDLAPVCVDAGQIEQVILNLAVNSRDAMPNGGTLTIETRNVVVSESSAGSDGPPPGSYVRLAIRDTGVGMDDETRQQMFEPFFTTKATGHGTGLGLSTSYGIIKQSGGEVVVASEVGHGTLISIYLPQTDEPVPAVETARATPATRGSETILVVEDDERIRSMVERMLKGAGYAVLLAANGQDALNLLAPQQHAVDLLLTDVVMPGMSGRDLAERVSSMYPTMKVLYTSGYTDDAIVHHGVLDDGVHFIGKPYATATLTAKVREVLDS